MRGGRVLIDCVAGAYLSGAGVTAVHTDLVYLEIEQTTIDAIETKIYWGNSKNLIEFMFGENSFHNVWYGLSIKTLTGGLLLIFEQCGVFHRTAVSILGLLLFHLETKTSGMQWNPFGKQALLSVHTSE